jgi:UDP-N-acetylmuramoylalanine--D-glutamate ligase
MTDQVSESQSFAPRVLVLGMGSTGASVARFLGARGEQAVFFDSRDTAPAGAEIKAAMPEAVLHTGPDLPSLPHTVERVIVSPGVPLDLPALVTARKRGLAIGSDIDLFMQECRAPVIAITGSNGKSTVTAMTAAMLESAGWRAPAGANLGPPALDLLDPRADAYVLELSSFQLERSQPISAAAAVLLNFSPDHLDSHGDLDSYAAAKRRVYAACEHAVINRDAPELVDVLPATASVSGFTLGQPGPDDFGILQHAGAAWLGCGERPLLPVSDLQISGRHNHANALAALALATALGADPLSLIPGLRQFAGLPHRLQCIAQHEGIRWVDDSKATNVGAAVTSIASIEDPLVLIAGGDAKGADFSALADALRGRAARAVLMGRDQALLAAALEPVCEVASAKDMPAAVALAGSLAQPGTTVLLAPACSSLDMYASYAARGDAFRQAVEVLCV